MTNEQRIKMIIRYGEIMKDYFSTIEPSNDEEELYKKLAIESADMLTKAAPFFLYFLNDLNEAETSYHGTFSVSTHRH